MSEIEARIGDNRGFLAAVGFTGDDVLSLKQEIRNRALELQATFSVNLHIEESYRDALERLQEAFDLVDFEKIQRRLINRYPNESTNIMTLPTLTNFRRWGERVQPKVREAIREAESAIENSFRWRARSVDIKAGRTRHKIEHLHEDAHHADVAAFDLYERLKSNEEALKRNGLTVRYAGAMLLYILEYDAEKPESKGREEASIGRFDTRRRAGERFTWLAEGCLHT